jgi:hypothetical protein
MVTWSGSCTLSHCDARSGCDGFLRYRTHPIAPAATMQIVAAPRLGGEADHHFCRNNHQERENRTEQNESRDSRSCGPISNTVH